MPARPALLAPDGENRRHAWSLRARLAFTAGRPFRSNGFSLRRLGRIIFRWTRAFELTGCGRRRRCCRRRFPPALPVGDALQMQARFCSSCRRPRWRSPLAVNRHAFPARLAAGGLVALRSSGEIRLSVHNADRGCVDSPAIFWGADASPAVEDSSESSLPFLSNSSRAGKILSVTGGMLVGCGGAGTAAPVTLSTAESFLAALVFGRSPPCVTGCDRE